MEDESILALMIILLILITFCLDDVLIFYWEKINIGRLGDSRVKHLKYFQ